MALMKVRDAEQLMKSMHTDPRMISLICGMMERLRIQHDQMMLFASEFNKLIDLSTDMMKKLAIRDGYLDKLGVKEMMQKADMGGMVNAVDAQDDDSDHTAGLLNKKN